MKNKLLSLAGIMCGYAAGIICILNFIVATDMQIAAAYTFSGVYCLALWLIFRK